MKLADEDSENGLQLVPESQGMNVPSACTIVIIAGFRLIHTKTTSTSKVLVSCSDLMLTSFCTSRAAFVVFYMSVHKTSCLYK